MVLLTLQDFQECQGTHCQPPSHAPNDPLPPESEYHDFLVAIHGDDFGIAIRLTGMIDESGFVPRHSGIHYLIGINTEHVATDTLGVGGSG